MGSLSILFVLRRQVAIEILEASREVAGGREPHHVADLGDAQLALHQQSFSMAQPYETDKLAWCLARDADHTPIELHTAHGHVVAHLLYSQFRVAEMLFDIACGLIDESLILCGDCRLWPDRTVQRDGACPCRSSWSMCSLKRSMLKGFLI